jgi:hypothetical protein
MVREGLLVKSIVVFAPAALAVLALTACSSAEKQAEQAQQFVDNQTGLVVAQRNATIDCAAANCDAAWALTKRYIEQRSSTEVTRSDAVAIDTDVPNRSGKPAYSATRAAKGTGATLTLFAQCRGMYGPDDTKGSDFNNCAEKIIKTQNGYAAYLRSPAAQ